VARMCARACPRSALQTFARTSRSAAKSWSSEEAHPADTSWGTKNFFLFFATCSLKFLFGHQMGHLMGHLLGHQMGHLLGHLMGHLLGHHIEMLGHHIGMLGHHIEMLGHQHHVITFENLFFPLGFLMNFGVPYVPLE
jgi:hypothetical protein